MIFDYPYTDMHELNLDWFLAKFKELVEEWNQVQGEWTSLHDYVQNYFDNLNVQTEIDHKLDALVADGTLATIMEPYINQALPSVVDGKLPAVVAAQIGAVVAAQISAVVADQLPAAVAGEAADWLAAHVDPDTGYVIDDSMTISQAAADAKTVGLITSNINERCNNIEHDSGVIEFTFKHGTVTASYVPVDNDQYKYVIIPRSIFEKYLTAIISGTTTYRMFIKCSFFTSSFVRQSTENNWRLLPNDGTIRIATVLSGLYDSSTAYVGVTMCYSTDSDIANIISTVPLDNIHISTVAEETLPVLKRTAAVATENKKSIGKLAFAEWDNVLMSSSGTADYSETVKDITCLSMLVDFNDLISGKQSKIYFNQSGYDIERMVICYDSDLHYVFKSTIDIINSGSNFINKNTILALYPSARYAYIRLRRLKSNTPKIWDPVWNDVYIGYDDNILDMIHALDVTNPVTIVDINGHGDYTTISDAITGTSDGDTILIMPGMYKEQVKLFGKTRHLVGVSKESCILYYDLPDYGEEPLQINMGSIENLTIIGGYGCTPVEEGTDPTCYAVHVEHANATPYELVIDNCNLISNVGAALGMGVRYNQTVKVKNTFLETKAPTQYSQYTSSWFNIGAVFIHNDASGSNLGDDGRVEFTNCEFKGVKAGQALQSQNNGNELTLRYLNCATWSTRYGTTDAITIRTTPTTGHIAGSDVVLDDISYGNNIALLNA